MTHKKICSSTQNWTSKDDREEELPMLDHSLRCQDEIDEIVDMMLTAHLDGRNILTIC